MDEAVLYHWKSSQSVLALLEKVASLSSHHIDMRQFDAINPPTRATVQALLRAFAPGREANRWG